MSVVVTRGHRKRWIVYVLGLIVAVPLACFLLLKDWHPDTSKVPSFAAYANTEADVLPHWSPDDKTIIYARGSATGSAVFIVSSKGGTATKLLADAGMPAWSPDGSQIVFGSDRRTGFHPLSGFGLGGAINLWASDAAAHQQHEITNLDAACLEPTWSPDGKQIAFTQFPGPRVMAMSVEGGEPRFVAEGISPAWSPDGKQFAYLGNLKGGPMARFRIYIRQAAGGETRQLRSYALDAEIYHAMPTLDWSPDSKRLLAIQLVEGRWQPAVINVEQDAVEQIVPVQGSVAGPRWSHDGKHMVYSVTDTGHPLRIEVMTPANGRVVDLSSNGEYTAASLVRIRSADGLEIPSWLYLPHDATQAKHPAIVWLHGTIPGQGGSTQDIFNPEIQYFVNQGFVVLAPNYRGSAGFGDELAKFSTGDNPVPDVTAAAGYLASLDSVDPKRIALLGYSFGGYLTMRTVVENPGMFAAAVDYYGPVDLARLYREDASMRPTLAALLGGTPDSTPDAYRSASPINFVDRLNTPVLLLYGTRDPFYGHSVELAKLLKQKGKSYEYLTYRFAGHGFRGKDSIDANQQILRFLSGHLRP